MKLLSFAMIFALTAGSAGAQSQAGIIWSDPGSISSRDLYWGNGSQARAPKPPFAFIEENLKGTTPKLVVKDAAGVTWDVKFDSEAHSEVAAARLMWAFGYPVEEMYYLHNGTISGVKNLKRASKDLAAGGRFENGARFKRRDPNMVKEGEWALANNPFNKEQAFSGLLILLALTNNWDTDLTKNTEIFAVKQPDGSLRKVYVVGDLGASFGRFDKPPKKWNLQEYRKDKLIASVQADAIVLNYRAYGTPPTRIPMEHARWFAKMASQLSRVQVKAAFEAAGTLPAEIDGYVDMFMSKIEELKTAAGGTL